ncbi:MAG: hypothetical protein ACOYNF_14705 [Rhodoferax sp.]
MTADSALVQAPAAATGTAALDMSEAEVRKGDISADKINGAYTVLTLERVP